MSERLMKSYLEELGQREVNVFLTTGIKLVGVIIAESETEFVFRSSVDKSDAILQKTGITGVFIKDTSTPFQFGSSKNRRVELKK